MNLPKHEKSTIINVIKYDLDGIFKTKRPELALQNLQVIEIQQKPQKATIRAKTFRQKLKIGETKLIEKKTVSRRM